MNAFLVFIGSLVLAASVAGAGVLVNQSAEGRLAGFGLLLIIPIAAGTAVIALGMVWQDYRSWVRRRSSE